MIVQTDKRQTFLIWDREDVPPNGEWINVLWQSTGEGGDLEYSIPDILEERSDALRESFLAWIYDLGQTDIRGKTLVDHLRLRPGFSYWWMTLIAEKCNAWKSRYIIDVIKLFLLCDLVSENSISTIILRSSNKKLAEIMRLWCGSCGLTFKWLPLQGLRESVPWTKRLYRLLPHPLQALISLTRYIWQRWPINQQSIHDNDADDAEMTFVDYLIHLDQEALRTGRFASNYWTDLVAAIDTEKVKMNWIHLYVQHEAIASVKNARDLIARFNQEAERQQSHTCLDDALSFSVLLRALVDYGRLVWMNLGLRTIKGRFHDNESRIDFWPLFREDWYKSMLGSEAMLNCLFLNLLERTFKRLPHQKLGVYLQENQCWEMALIHAWRVAGHGQLIGVAHSTVRYWDLRYFVDPRNYERTGHHGIPLPDKTALNGLAALTVCRRGGYPADQIVEVEALRYLYLTDMLPAIGVGNVHANAPIRLLVLSDYMSEITDRQMQWLVDAIPLLPDNIRYTVKAHPSCPVEAADYPSLQLQMAVSPLGSELRKCDVVYSSNITSAAVDAYCMGLPVVSMLNSGSFNMSPLRGLEGVVYVRNAAELAGAIRGIGKCTRASVPPYFHLDKGLPRWRKLLGLPPFKSEETAVVGR